MTSCAVTHDIEKHLKESDAEDRISEFKAKWLYDEVVERIKELADNGRCEISGKSHDMMDIISKASELQREDIANVLVCCLNFDMHRALLEDVLHRIIAALYTEKEIHEAYLSSLQKDGE